MFFCYKAESGHPKIGDVSPDADVGRLADIYPDNIYFEADLMVPQSQKIVAIIAGCAECQGGDTEVPLLEAEIFTSWVEAKTTMESRSGRGRIWVPHPQGGEHFMTSLGSVWLLPLSEVSEVKGID